MKERKRLFCPICGGPLTAWLGFRAGLIYFCKRCGYRGPLTVKLSDEEIEKLRIEYKKKEVKK